MIASRQRQHRAQSIIFVAMVIMISSIATLICIIVNVITIINININIITVMSP